MSFLKSIKLLFPALVPAWNFFDVIAPSPRIQFILLDRDKQPVINWTVFRSRVEHITIIETLKKMLWNPRWNESLFLVSCAERLIERYTEHSEIEILNRIIRDYPHEDKAQYLQFRLVFIRREGSKLKEEILFTSRKQELIREEE